MKTSAKLSVMIDQTAAVLMVMFVATALQAAPIDLRIDLGNKAGETAGNWNNPGGTDPLHLTGSYPDLIDFSTGLGTGVGINFGTYPWSQFNGDSSGVFPDQSWLVQPATQDGTGWTHSIYNGAAITLSGLVESRYLVEVVSARDAYYSNSISVNGALANRTYLGTPVEDPWDVQSHGLYPGNWLIWDNVSPIVGEITIQMSTFATGMGIINAVRVVGGDPVVPEPSSLAMFGIGALGLFGYSRRRRQTSAAARDLYKGRYAQILSACSGGITNTRLSAPPGRMVKISAQEWVPYWSSPQTIDSPPAKCSTGHPDRDDDCPPQTPLGWRLLVSFATGRIGCADHRQDARFDRFG